MPEFNTFHVNGTMTIAVREGIMNEFKGSDFSVISNARCLTEGVDLPAVDMVAFMSPKKSKVDIIQATGRAMRKAPRNPYKKVGYILVPLYLEMTTGESIENAVCKTDFEEVWDVLQALQEQDEVLADIIRQIQEDKGKGEGQKGDDFGDIIDILGVDISLKILQESITAVCVERLGFTWDFRYGELKKYKEQFGNCNVPAHRKECKQLGSWVHRQRANYQKRILSSDRIKRLEEIGFDWDPFESLWEEMFKTLKEYKDKHENCNVPAYWSENKQLGMWVGVQRRAYKKGNLNEDRIKRLDDIGFTLDPNEVLWEEMLELLKEYKKEHGNCNVPKRLSKNKPLATWVSNQRVSYRKGILSEDRIRRLEDIGIELTYNRKEKEDEGWAEMLEGLMEYKAEYGNCNVPNRWPKNEPLGYWVTAQRQGYKNNKLSEDRIKRLEEIGLVWDMLESQWEEFFVALKEYKKKFGDCNVPDGWPKNKQLATWVSNQRTTFKNGTLSEDCIKRLEEIRFVWDTLEAQWDEMFDVLKEYKEEYGNCNVPQRWSENKQLATWVSNQRTNYKNRKLSTDHIKRLEDIGFEWKRISYTYYKLPWEDVFTMLKEYKDKHGNCNVPSLYKENKQLANWVQTQRTTFKNGTLNEDRIKRLEEIGFVWNILKR